MDPFALVIFGITSNLAKLKLLPALYNLAKNNLLPKDMTIIGVGRRSLSDSEFQNHIKTSIRSKLGEVDGKTLDHLVSHSHYLSGHVDPKDSDLYPRLKTLLQDHPHCDNHLFYLATFPDLYADIFANMAEADLIQNPKGWTRVLIEKPFGHDQKSAKHLDDLLGRYFKETQVFRIDHYLGKETMQNILTFRFGNSLFEHLLNADHVDHIQITLSETFGVGDRGEGYDKIGAFKDVGQNHILQMLAAVTMANPKTFTNDAITTERVKIFSHLLPFPTKVVFGQYASYKTEEKIPQTSQTETFFALKTELSSGAWQGVPIYLRSGKKLAKSVAEIHIVFKSSSHHIFGHLEHGGQPNILTFRLQPNEGISFQILTKVPGHTWDLTSDTLTYTYPPSNLPEAYEKLIGDAIRGDQTFFTDSEEIELEWKFADHILGAKPNVVIYEDNTWGPIEATKLIEADGRSWLDPV